MTGIPVVAAVFTIATISACASESQSAVASPSDISGGEIYQGLCASCHAADLAGAPNWRTPNDDGSYPPPPHDSSGHTWHHPDGLLIHIIRDGSDFPQSRMPAFGVRLTDEEIEAVLEFIKAHWGAEEAGYQRQVTEQAKTQPLGVLSHASPLL